MIDDNNDESGGVGWMERWKGGWMGKMIVNGSMHGMCFTSRV
jgi:hypothetical protein